MNQLTAIAGCVALVVAVGCRSRPAAPPKQFDYQRERAVIEARVMQIFTNAVLLKPRETVPSTDPAFTLAPLLIREVADSNTSSNCGPATVFYHPGVVQIGGIARPQMSYLWSCGNENMSFRGVRLTLDSHGLPVIWEVLDDQPGARVVFVSQSLEERGRTAFGPPATGRRFAVEQPLSIAPDVVVARVNDDGPVAMGPIVHQTASHEVNAIICRCMPTQARQLVATVYYELKPASVLTNVDLEIWGVNPRLADELRLPPNF